MKYHILIVLSLFLLAQAHAQDLTKKDTLEIAEQCKLDLNADCYSFCYGISFGRGFSVENAQKCVQLSKNKTENILNSEGEHIPMLVGTVGKVKGRQFTEVISKERPDFNKYCPLLLLHKSEGKENLHLVSRGNPIKLSDVTIDIQYHKGQVVKHCTVGKFELLN